MIIVTKEFTFPMGENQKAEALAKEYKELFDPSSSCRISANASGNVHRVFVEDEYESMADYEVKWPERMATPEFQAWLPTLFDESVPNEFVAETAEIMSDFHPVGMRAMLRAYADADLRSMLSTIDVPTLLLYGDADRRSPLTVANEMHDNIAHSKLKIMSGVGHMVNAEVPDEFNSVIRGFLRSHL